MGFLCCICQEDLNQKRPGSQDSDNSKVQDRPIVTTKCGHLYHSNCLSSWFQKKGSEVWTTKECPVCRMSLTVATDLVRIFPNSADDGCPTIEEYKAHVSKLESANATLSGRLELYFLRSRDQEKKILQLNKDLERVQKGYIMEKQKSAQLHTDAAKVKNENEELRNVIISLNKAIASGYNGLNLGNGQYGLYGEVKSGAPGFPSQYGGQRGMQPPVGNMSLLLNGQTLNVSASPTVPTQSTWPPSKPINNQPVTSSSSGIEIRDAFGYTNLNSSNSNTNNNQNQHSQADDVSQLGSMFQMMGGLRSSNGTSVLGSLYGEPDIKSFVDENSSSGLDSDSSKADSEPGDHFLKNVVSNKNMFANNNINDSYVNNITSSSSNTVVDSLKEPNKTSSSYGFQDNSNGKSSSLNSSGNENEMDQPPSDEMMDAILNSKPQSSGQDSDQYFVQRKYAPKLAKKSKGKTKWKTVEIEEEKKMYGKFYCDNCTAKWGTARHVFNQAQTCMRCNETVFPYAQGPVMTKEELAQEKLNRKRKS